MTEDRDMGVGFGDLQDDLETESYPLTNEELLEKYGDREVDHANGAATLREILGPMGENTYEGADGVRQAVLTMIGDDAEGRKDYTDREPDATGEEYDQQSF